MSRADRRYDVDKLLVIRLADSRWRKGLIELDLAGIAVDVLHDIHDVLGIESNRQFRTFNRGGNRLFGITDIRVVRGNMNLIVRKFQLDDVVIASAGNQ